MNGKEQNRSKWNDFDRKEGTIKELQARLLIRSHLKFQGRVLISKNRYGGCLLSSAAEY